MVDTQILGGVKANSHKLIYFLAVNCVQMIYLSKFMPDSEFHLMIFNSKKGLTNQKVGLCMTAATD